MGLVILGFAVYVIVSYIVQALSPYPPLTTFSIVLALFLACVSLVPLMGAFLRRPHPDAVEVRDDGLVLRYADRPPLRFAWDRRPIELAYDMRAMPYGRPPPAGMEVQMYVLLSAQDPSNASMRPVEVDVSGTAFDEVKAHMAAAGFTVRTRQWSRRRPGQLVEFLTSEDEPDEPWPDAPEGFRRWSRSAVAHEADPPAKGT